MASQKISLSPTPFRVSIPKEALSALYKLVELSPIPGPFYEGQQAKFGVTSSWMTAAKSHWLTKFDWTNFERKLNQYPQFTAPVTNRDGRTYTLHFLHLRATSPTASPLLLLHGWPGSFAEFYRLIPYLQGHFHIVIPSLPGYCFSSAPPLDKNFDLQDCAYLMDNLMRGLGYNKYIAQGGDLGAFISRLLGTGEYPSCVGIHANFVWLLARRELAPISSLDMPDQDGLKQANQFRTTGAAYAMEHATRPSTISHVLSSSPLALLAWIGEKFLTWTDAPHPDVGFIVEMVALWWLTKTPATAIWAYRDIFLAERLVWWNQVLPGERLHITVPFGFSAFPKELTPVPLLWAKKTGKLVLYRSHEVGGHFPGLEQPKTLAKDISDFVKIVEQGQKIKARL